MHMSDIDVRLAQQRYEDALRHARLLRLIRAANAHPVPAAAEPAHPRSLLSRVWAALFARGAARRAEAPEPAALRQNSALR